MTIEALAGDVVALLDCLGIAEADLFGFSLGGLVRARSRWARLPGSASSSSPLRTPTAHRAARARATGRGPPADPG
jgi:hypothetical protein